MIKYGDSGVHIELGDDASKVLYNAAKITWKNRTGKIGDIIKPFDDFSGVRGINVSNLPDGTLMGLNFDGVGTKMEIAERIDDHRTIAYDLFAMVSDDAVRDGAEPVVLGSILDVRSLEEGKETHIDKVKQLAEGYVNAAKEANVAVINGEVAELGNRVGGYGKFNYNWGAGLVWFAKEDRMFTGKEIEVGDLLIGLEEKGIRSNGASLSRKIVEDKYGEKWHEESYNGENLAKLLLEPSKIYTKAVVEMIGGYDMEPKADVNGVVHVTGGGIPGKVGRALRPKKLGAYIDFPFDSPKIMNYCQHWGEVSDEEAYKTWNMGQGMIIITSEENDVKKVAREHNIDSKVIGVVSDKLGIHIKSKGFYSYDQLINFV